MATTHLLALIPARFRPAVFLALLALTLLLMGVFAITAGPLSTEAAPQGIVSLELAGSEEQAVQILASWDANTQLRASFGLGFDYLYMPAYSTTIALACLWAGDILSRRRWRLAALGNTLAWGLWLAAVFDAVENVALVIVLWRTAASPWPQVSFWCASFKFALIFVGLAYAAYGALAAIASGRMRGQPVGPASDRGAVGR